jgi:hypothetical protein
MVILTKSVRNPTARWIHFQYKTDPVIAIQGQFLTDEIMTTNGIRGVYPLDSLPVVPATKDPALADWSILDGTFEATKVRTAYVAALVKFGGKEVWLADSILGWGRKLKTLSPAEHARLATWDKLGTVKPGGGNNAGRALTFADCKGEHWTLLIKILGIGAGITATTSVPERKSIIKNFFLHGTGSLDKVTRVHGVPIAKPTSLEARWWWITKGPTVTDNNRWVFLCKADVNAAGDRPQSIEEDSAQVLVKAKAYADDDPLAPEMGIAFPDIILATDDAAKDLFDIQNSQEYAIDELNKQVQAAHDLFLLLKEDWEQPTRETDYLDDSRLGDEKRMTITLLATTLPALEDTKLPNGQPAFQDLLAWFKKEAPSFANECSEAFRDATTRPPGSPGAFRKEFLYIKNSVLEGRTFYGDLIARKLIPYWSILGQNDDIDQGSENPLLRNVIRMKDYKSVISTATQQQTGSGNNADLALALSKLIGLQSNEKYIPEDTWEELMAGTIKPCTIDTTYYHTTQLERTYDENHVARKVLAANGITKATDLTIPEFDTKAGATTAVHKIPDASLKHRLNSSSVEKQQVVAFYHALLSLAMNQPVGKFNKRYDFRGVEVRTINLNLRKVRNKVITDPDDPKLDSDEWFSYPTPTEVQSTTIEAAEIECSLSTQLSQILACAGYFRGTEDMTAWRNSIKSHTDAPQLAKIANFYKIRSHLLFWTAIGFSDMDCPASSATQFVTFYMHRAQSTFCVRALCVDTKKDKANDQKFPNLKVKNNKLNKRQRANENKDRRAAKSAKLSGGHPLILPPTSGGGAGNNTMSGQVDLSKLQANQLPLPTGIYARSFDANQGIVPWIWAQHVRKFYKTYGASHELLTSAPDATNKCQCGAGGGNHAPAGCITILVLRKWSPNAGISVNSTRAEMHQALTALKASKGLSEK